MQTVLYRGTKLTADQAKQVPYLTFFRCEGCIRAHTLPTAQPVHIFVGILSDTLVFAASHDSRLYAHLLLV